MPEMPRNLTQELNRALAGDADARDHVLVTVYSQLHRIANSVMRSNPNEQILQPSALINEAYIKLFHGGTGLNVESRNHFFAAAAGQMRNVIMDSARKKNTGKRKGISVEFNEIFHGGVTSNRALLALDDALKGLEIISPSLVQIVNLRFFGGFTYEEVAAITGTNVMHVRREWDKAKAYLLTQLKARGEI